MDESQYKLIESVIKGATEGTIAAGGDLAKDAAKSALTKLKSVFGWKSDPTPEQGKSLAQAAIAQQPALAEQAAAVLHDYRTQILSTSTHSLGSMDLRGALIGQIKQANVKNNTGTINL